MTFSIDIEGDWLGGTADSDDATFGALVVAADGVAFTEVADSISKSTRRSIRVSTVAVARWLLLEWWRLRWEAQPDGVPSLAWRAAHSMAGLGGGFAWPDLTIASDGEYVQVSVGAERTADAAAIRYFCEERVEIPVAEWERSVERFLDKVEGRLADVLPGDREIGELRAELREERSDAALARRRRREAIAGFSPGEAPDGWSEDVDVLAKMIGSASTDDLLVLDRDVTSARRRVDTLRASKHTIDLGSVTGLVSPSGGKPWQRGATGAQAARKKLGQPKGPLSNEALSDILGNTFPLEDRHDAPALGAFRPADGGGTASVILDGRSTKQRFAVARLMGLAAQRASTDEVLVLTGAKTAAQRAARAFAQELLLPWDELAEATDRDGTGEEVIARIAERYVVSEMLVTTTLVNRGKLQRGYLERYAS